MTVYVEYAFLENFLIDGALLFLALKALKMPIRWLRLFISAVVGAVFAVIFPLLSLSKLLGLSLKVAVGLSLPLIAIERVKTKKEWGRYALSAIFFFCMTFLFGGALLGGMENFALATLPWWVVAIFFALATPILLILIGKFYKRRGVQRQIYPCNLYFGEKTVETQGFLDSGNVATKNGLPVCFLSADIYYDLLEDFLFTDGKDRGQVLSEMKITTMAGEKNICVYRGYVMIKQGEKRKREVYFALSKNMIGREYKVIFGADLGDEV